MSELLRRLPFSVPASRTPGQGVVGLEPVSGDIQLRTPKLSRLLPSVGKHKASKQEREKLWEPTEKAPVSGVYDIVDEDGNYLHSQITCHEDEDFPATHSHYARELDELLEEKGDDGSGTGRIVHHYRYRLAYEATHLTQQEPDAPQRAPMGNRIYLPGEIVPTSGIYNVVDRKGRYLRHQRACVHSKIGDVAKENRFPETKGPKPGTYGYMLDYATKHLSD
jgi:hypothetical protein